MTTESILWCVIVVLVLALLISIWMCHHACQYNYSQGYIAALNYRIKKDREPDAA